MRLAALAMVILTVFWSTPTTQLPGTVMVGSQDDTFGVPFGDGIGFPDAAGRESLVFAVLPRLDTMPVMPDIPEGLAVIAPDPLPISSHNVQGFQLSDVEPVAARATASPENLRKVTAKSLNLRDAPSRKGTVLMSLRQGARTYLTGEQRKGWVQVVASETGLRGWVYASYLRRVESCDGSFLIGRRPSKFSKSRLLPWSVRLVRTCARIVQHMQALGVAEIAAVRSPSDVDYLGASGPYGGFCCRSSTP